MSITLAQFWMGRDKVYAPQLTDEIRRNAAETVRRANLLLVAAKKKGGVTSGWRPPAVNAATKGAAKRSNHMLGLAVDLSDDDGTLDVWCMANLPTLERLGLWLEHPSKTRRWCHVQTVPPRSGNRVFMP